MSKLNIAIIGAGIGGMSAALGLAQSGFAVGLAVDAGVGPRRLSADRGGERGGGGHPGPGGPP